MTELLLRELAPADLDAVAAIEAQVSLDPWSRDLFAGELGVHHATRHWLVAVDERALVGFVGMMFVPDELGDSSEAHVMNVAVDPRRSREGIARRLLAAAFEDALDRGARHVTLEVRVSNVAARALYQQFGFAPVGVRPRYYPDGEDALILWVHDIASDEFRSRLVHLNASDLSGQATPKA